jgi:hypothetical protein
MVEMEETERGGKGTDAKKELSGKAMALDRTGKEEQREKQRRLKFVYKRMKLMVEKEGTEREGKGTIAKKEWMRRQLLR